MVWRSWEGGSKEVMNGALLWTFESFMRGFHACVQPFRSLLPYMLLFLQLCFPDIESRIRDLRHLDSPLLGNE
jgi:hypothetical protein